jgi:hypothetical protein
LGEKETPAFRKLKNDFIGKIDHPEGRRTRRGERRKYVRRKWSTVPNTADRSSDRAGNGPLDLAKEVPGGWNGAVSEEWSLMGMVKNE